MIDSRLKCCMVWIMNIHLITYYALFVEAAVASFGVIERKGKIRKPTQITFC